MISFTPIWVLILISVLIFWGCAGVEEGIDVIPVQEISYNDKQPFVSYKVNKGESLSVIAMQYTGSYKTWKIIAAFNRIARGEGSPLFFISRYDAPPGRAGSFNYYVTFLGLLVRSFQWVHYQEFVAEMKE